MNYAVTLLTRCDCGIFRVKVEDGLAGLPVLMEALLLLLLCLAANPAAAYNVVGFAPGLLISCDEAAQ